MDPEYLLKVLLEQQDGRARWIFSEAGVNIPLFLEAIHKYIRVLPKSLDVSDISPRQNLDWVIQQAKKYKNELGDSFISVDHLILALTIDQLTNGKQLFKDFRLCKRSIKDAVLALRGPSRAVNQDPDGKYKALKKYGKCLTTLAKAGKLDPVIRRDDEMNRCFEILSGKETPLLIGKAGVGKTAIAAGLAQRIVQGDVPQGFINCRLISLNVLALLTGNRGDFEKRLNNVRKEVIDSRGQIILFVDDIHTLVRAGVANGIMNLLNFVLSRGEIMCIGATTFDDYDEFFAGDAATERLFQQVYVNEPSGYETLYILGGLRECYEIRHGVCISDAALIEATDLCELYVKEGVFPDKVIRLIDRAASHLKSENTTKASQRIMCVRFEFNIARQDLKGKHVKASKDSLKHVKAELSLLKQRRDEVIMLWERAQSLMRRASSIKQEIFRVNLGIQQAERVCYLDRLTELKDKTLNNLECELANVEKDLSLCMSCGKFLIREEVTPNDIAETLSRSHGVRAPYYRRSSSYSEKPERKLRKSGVGQLHGVRASRLNIVHLHTHVFGQYHALKAVEDTILNASCSTSRRRPIATFMFMGPPSVGKKTLAKEIASACFRTE